jgi:small subunit ribosomal protein S9
MNSIENLFSGVGKRKTSVAKIFLKKGNGVITVNNKPFENSFLTLKEDRELIKNPLILVNLNNQYDIDIKVRGGGMIAQIDAIKLAVAKAICTISEEYRPLLNQQLFLRRDSRIKERRKYGLRKARKAPQYSKR